MRKALAVVLTPLAVAVSVVAVAPSAHAAVACSTAGAGGDWTSFGHDHANTRTQPNELSIGRSNVTRLAKAWTFIPNEGGHAAALNSTATEAGGCVYVGTSQGWVYALSAATGAVQWKTQMLASLRGLGGTIVGAITIEGGRAYVLVNQQADGSGNGPYAAALDAHTGAVLWNSPPLETHLGSYTNASPAIFNNVLIAGWSPPESDPTGTGGVALIDTATGGLMKRVYTIPLARQAQGYAGGGIWTNPAIDGAGYAYAGTGNPYSKTKEDPNTNAIIKIDVNPARPTTFGQIVGALKGNIDQYTQALQFLADSPICAATAQYFNTTFFDDPICGQLDLDFGASPNLFTINGQQVVGDLQKAGVYHVATTANMHYKWSRIVGTPCVVCNASATATAGGKIYGEGTLGGFAFKLNQANGNYGYISPVADAIHYQSFSVANNVVYTVDTLGFLDAFDSVTGLPLARRPLLPDSGQVVIALSSTGVTIARNSVFVSVGSQVNSGVPLPENGYLVALKTP